MPHCLKEGVLFLISIPRALSPGRNKAPARHWIEHTASLHHSRGTPWWLKPWGQGAITKGEEKDSKKKGAHANPAEKTVTSLLYNQRDSDSPGQPFQNKAPWAVPSPLAPCLSWMALSYFMGLRPHTARLRSWDAQETPATGFTAPFRSVMLVEGKQGGGRINIHPPAMQGGRQGASLPETKCSRGCSKNRASGNTVHKHFWWNNIQYGSLKPATYRSPKPVT